MEDIIHGYLGILLPIPPNVWQFLQDFSETEINGEFPQDFQWGGIHLEWTYILGSYAGVPSLGGLPAKWNRRCMDQNSHSYDFCLGQVHELVKVGIGMHF